MSTRRYLSGLDRYDLQRDPDDHVIDKVLPAEPGPTHAVVEPLHQRARPLQEPAFFNPSSYLTALCGKRVKVLLPLGFDPAEDDACPKSVGPVLRGER